MQSIAELAGVSAITVSRALKSNATVSKATRDRVLEFVRRTGYVPDVTARVFASGRSGFVAVLVPSINNSNFADTTLGMTAALEKAGLQVPLGDTGYSVEREERLRAAAGMKGDGTPKASSAGDGSESAFQRIRAKQCQAGAVPEPLNQQGWQLVDELNRAFNKAPWSGYVSTIHLVTPDNIAFDGGPRNIFDPDNGYRDQYKNIWGVK
jgi:ABC-type sugar transport system substrate-binding protein